MTKKFCDICAGALGSNEVAVKAVESVDGERIFAAPFYKISCNPHVTPDVCLACRIRLVELWIESARKELAEHPERE